MFGIFLPVDKAHFLHFQGLLYSLKDLLNVDYKIHIIDIGLNIKQIEILNKRFSFLNFEINKLKSSRDDKLSYRFKIKTIEMMYNSNYDYTMMLDSKNHLKLCLSSIVINVEKYNVLINEIVALEYEWTHKTCLLNMGIINDMEIINSNQYQSNNPVFYNKKCKDIFLDIIKYGNDDNCLCPIGSMKSLIGGEKCTHRQDQSVISIVLKKHNIRAVNLIYSNYHNTIHTDF